MQHACLPSDVEPKDRNLLEQVKEAQRRVYAKIDEVVGLRLNRPREIEQLVASRVDRPISVPVSLFFVFLCVCVCVCVCVCLCLCMPSMHADF
jgi:hypothetical protein